MMLVVVKGEAEEKAKRGANFNSCRQSPCCYCCLFLDKRSQELGGRKVPTWLTLFAIHAHMNMSVSVWKAEGRRRRVTFDSGGAKGSENTARVE